ncbi:TULIP family P47-like protein [Aestuariivirga sp.]|uniref:TULIP family P47-like protein n=1 Tax=Aestuariivirga sp. TaxID=2650926 RepID=UPI003593DF2D
MAIPTDISLQGWDTANVTTFDVVNTAIATQAATPKTFAGTPADLQAIPTVSGNWTAWSIVPGGSGGTLRMKLPIASGTATFSTPVKGSQALAAANSQTVTISNNGLTATGGATGIQSALAIIGATAGKFYFEITMGSGVNFNAQIGVAASAGATRDFGDDPLGYAYRSSGYMLNGGNVYGLAANGSIVQNRTNPATTWEAAGDVAGIAVDLDARKVWFRGKDGAWLGAGADPVAGKNPAFTLPASIEMFPAVGVANRDSITANFGDTPFKHAVPAGFRGGWRSVTVSTVKLDGSEINADVTLKAVAAGGKTTVVPDSSGAAAGTAVTVTSLTIPASIAHTQHQLNEMMLAFDDVLNGSIDQFKTVFASIDEATPMATGNLAWMSPTAVAYAVADSTAGGAGLFALLAMTASRSAGANPQQIAPEIIVSLPKGANSVLAISGERFISQILFTSAQTIMANSKGGDFEIDGLGMVITNKNALPWRQVKLPDGNTITPSVPAKGLRIEVIGNQIVVTFTGVTFDVPGWRFGGKDIATFGFKQYFYLSLEQRADKKNVLVVKNQDPDGPATDDAPNIKDFVIAYNLDPTAISNQETLEWTAIGLAIFTVLDVAYVAGAWVYRSRQLASDIDSAAAAGNGQVQVQGTELKPYAPSSNAGKWIAPNGSEYDSTESVMREIVYDASLPAQRGGMCSFGELATITKVAIVGGVVTALGAGIAGGLAGTKEFARYTSGEVDTLRDALTFDYFLDQVLAAYTWPGTKTWTLKGARLAKSLLIYGEMK